MENEVEQMGAPAAMRRRARELWSDWMLARASLWNVLGSEDPSKTAFRRFVWLGEYMVDFCAPAQRLVVEIDGDPQDAECAQDARRHAALEAMGYRVLRLQSRQVLEGMSGVLLAIEQARETRPSPSPTPSSPNALGEEGVGEGEGSFRSDASPKVSEEGTRAGEGSTWAHVSPIIRARAQELRRHPTRAEAVLWQGLRAHRLGGLKFRRQHPIGRFVADFYCHSQRLIIEIDGDVHDKERDAARSEYLEDRGYRIIRFRNEEVLDNMDRVLSAIRSACRMGP